jgi:hypothetical protein
MLKSNCSKAVVLRLLDGEVDLGGEHRLLKILVVAGDRGVELILGRGLQVAMQLVALDLGIHDLLVLHLVEEVGVLDLRILAHVCALLDHRPQHQEADEDEDPEHDCFNA